MATAGVASWPVGIPWKDPTRGALMGRPGGLLEGWYPEGTWARRTYPNCTFESQFLSLQTLGCGECGVPTWWGWITRKKRNRWLVQMPWTHEISIQTEEVGNHLNDKVGPISHNLVIILICHLSFLPLIGAIEYQPNNLTGIPTPLAHLSKTSQEPQQKSITPYLIHNGPNFWGHPKVNQMTASCGKVLMCSPSRCQLKPISSGAAMHSRSPGAAVDAPSTSPSSRKATPQMARKASGKVDH